MLDTTVLTDFWPLLLATLHLAVGVLVSGHVVLHKSDVRAAIGWVGIIWLTPLLGSLLYMMFGVNRIHRRAQALRAPSRVPATLGSECSRTAAEVRDLLGPDAGQFDALARVNRQITGRALLGGNRLQALVNGDEAYPAMLAAIDEAEESIHLGTYIFDNDRAGRMFLEALRRAVQRGVEVRVLIDDVGTRYTWPPIVWSLRRAGIPTKTFLPTLAPWKFRYSNLRSHRKLLIIDSRLGFTGGMNIREGNQLSIQPRYPVQDIHFRIEGPVVNQLQEVFAVDWAFCSGELLQGERWYPELPDVGPTLARGITDGPDDDLEKLQTVLLAALGCAQSSIYIMTPYFLPDTALMTALELAALRGLDLNIVLPQKNNLKLVQWASTAQYEELVEAGCKVWLSPPPFDHSKLMIVDESWLLLGSANWDPRSLRLNFEFNVECYDPDLAQEMARLVRVRIGQSRAVDLEQLRSLPLVWKLRNNIARLASPYL